MFPKLQNVDQQTWFVYMQSGFSINKRGKKESQENLGDSGGHFYWNIRVLSLYPLGI